MADLATIQDVVLGCQHDQWRSRNKGVASSIILPYNDVFGFGLVISQITFANTFSITQIVDSQTIQNIYFYINFYSKYKILY